MNNSSKINKLKSILSAMAGVSCNMSDKELQEQVNIIENEYTVKVLENPYNNLPSLENMGPFKSGKERRRERRKQERARRKAL